MDERRSAAMTRLVCLSAAALLPCVHGCGRAPASASGESAVVRDGPGDEAAARDASRFTKLVARTALRERALGLLSQMTAAQQPEVRANAAEALAATPTRLKPHAAALLTDPNPGVRGVTAMAVGKAKLEGFGDELRRISRESNPVVRISALYALRNTGEEVDLSPLGDMLLSPQPRVRAQAAFVLGELGDASALPMLREVARAADVHGSYGEIRSMELQIAEARAKLGDIEAMHEIRAALFPAQPDDLEATALACQIVGGLRDRTQVDRLVNLTTMKDDHGQTMPAEVRLAAAGALAKIGLRQGSFIAAEYVHSTVEPQRSQAAYVLGETGQIANLVTLEKMLEDPSGRVQVAAAAAIVRITDAPAR